MRKRINAIKKTIYIVFALLTIGLSIASGLLLFRFIFITQEDKPWKYLGVIFLIIFGILMFGYSANHLVKMMPKRKRKF